MQPLLIILLLLSILTNVLLILLLLRSGQQNTAEDQPDEIARIVRDEVEAETEVLADQLRVMQGEVTRTTSASARDMGTLLAESQRQSQEAATARLDAIDRAGAARQRAANDALLAQLQVLETRLKNLEDTNANRLDGVRATLLQGMANIRADNNKSWMKSAARWTKSWKPRCSAGSANRSGRSAPSWNRCTRAWARCRTLPPMWAA